MNGWVDGSPRAAGCGYAIDLGIVVPPLFYSWVAFSLSMNPLDSFFNGWKDGWMDIQSIVMYIVEYGVPEKGWFLSSYRL